MDRWSGLIQVSLGFGFLLLVLWFVRRVTRQLKSEQGFAYTPEMVEPHRRIAVAVQRHPKGEWLSTSDGHRLRITQIHRNLKFMVFDIERLGPESLSVVPGERVVHESFVIGLDKPPVHRRIRPAYGGEGNTLYTVDEKPLDATDFREKFLPAMIVDVDDLTVLAVQLETARLSE